MHLLFERDEFGERLRYRPAMWRTLKATLSAWWIDWRARAVRQRSLVRLAEMEEWQLRDIGVTRADVNRMLERNGIGRDLVGPIQPH